MSYLVAYEVGRLYKPLLDISNQSLSLRDLIFSAPGIRAYWPLGAVSYVPQWFNLIDALSNFSHSGTPVVGADNYMAYTEFDGSSQYLTAPFAGGYISGTETFINSAIRGVTVGGWVNLDTVGTIQTLFSRWGVIGNRAIILLLDGSGNWRFSVSADGTATAAISGGAGTAGGWQFVCGRFSPGSHVDVFVSGVSASVATGLTSVYNSSADARIGADSNVPPQYLDGKIAHVFLAASYISDPYLDKIWRAGKTRAGI